MSLQKLSILAFLAVTTLQAQKEANNWYFGVFAGITFNTNPPTALTNGQLYTGEGCASISTPEGRLLFYTNGTDVWDSTHTRMPNGNGLKGNTSTSQSAIIVPRPDSPHIYYIFTIGAEANADGLRYNEVNMHLNKGKGDVVSSVKNILLKVPVCEKITAIRKGNKNEYWVLATKFQTDTFLAYSVTAAGVIHAPEAYSTGFKISGVTRNSIGCMKVSPNGRKLAFTTYNLDSIVVADFDATTGKISNLWSTYLHNSYGIEFSPNSNYLYATAEDNIRLYQYNLSSGNMLAFRASQKVVDSTYYPYNLQLGPDGKIYIAMLNMQFLAVIHAPDSLNCRPQNNYISLSGKKGMIGLPSFVQSFFRHTTVSVGRACVNDSSTFNIKCNYDIDSIHWDFDDPGSGSDNFSQKTGNILHIYKQAGKYRAKVSIYHSGIRQIEHVEFTVYKTVKPYLGKDTAYCHAFTRTIQPQKNFPDYLWNWYGMKTKSIDISQKGTYILKTKDSNDCAAADTIKISNPIVNARFRLSDTLQCLEGNILQLKDSSYYKDGYRLKSTWYLGDGTIQPDSIINKTYDKSGSYIIKLVVENHAHCKDSMSRPIKFLPKFKVFIGNDTAFCGKFSHLIKAGSGFKTYKWSTGDTTMQVTVNAKGIYSVKVLDSNTCPNGDTMDIDQIPNPKIKLSYDSVTCRYVFLSVDSLKGISYLWSTGETNPAIQVAAKGWYAIKASHRFCSQMDSILVDQLAKPEVDLGPDTDLCSHDVLLRTKAQGKYLWNTMETGPSIVVNQAGPYWLTVSRNNCQASDTVYITPCEEMRYYIPNSFSPNGDQTNDVFRISGSNIVFMELEIFNRWGEMVLSTQGHDPFWDGTYKNTDCQESVYFYKVMLKGKMDGDIEYLNGTVTLLR